MARGPASQRPSPYSAAEPSLSWGAPAFSSPPASQQQQSPSIQTPRTQRGGSDGGSTTIPTLRRLARWRQRGSPFVQTTRTQMGGDSGSLEEKAEQAAPPRITCTSARAGRRPQPPNRAAMAGPRLTAPKPLLSSRAPPRGSSRLLFPTRRSAAAAAGSPRRAPRMATTAAAAAAVEARHPSAPPA